MSDADIRRIFREELARFFRSGTGSPRGSAHLDEGNPECDELESMDHTSTETSSASTSSLEAAEAEGRRLTRRLQQGLPPTRVLPERATRRKASR